MSEETLIVAVRIAGALHFVTLVIACFTPIPPNWDANLASLPEMHRRFAVAQNVFIGATIATLGLFSLCLAPEMISGTPLARAVCGATSLFWGARLLVLPWLRVKPALTSTGLRVGFVFLQLECAAYAAAYCWLALR